MSNYLIADTLIRIKNSYRVGHREVTVSYSKVIHSLCKLLEEQGFIEKVQVGKNRAFDKSKKEIILKLKFHKRKPALTDLRIISKPSLRVYVSKKRLLIGRLGKLGIQIVSTSKGIMTGNEARKKGLGGELISEVW